MNLLLVLRTDILSTLTVLFMIIYEVYCSRYRKERNYFLPFASMCLGHDIFALITEITVNTPSVPKYINDGAHILFFFFSLGFSFLYFKYVLSLLMPRRDQRKYLIPTAVVCCVAVIVMFFSDIRYEQGFDTKYSAGVGPTLCYVTGFVLFIAADVLLAVYHKRINKSVLFFALPLSGMAMGLLVVQILVPEFLFTGSALTLTALGVFFAIENPVGWMQERAFIDHDTKVWNRNCYEHDLEARLPAELESGKQFYYVLGDINGLKAVNDKLGHLKGDRLIADSATMLTETLHSAYRVYRIGGDEFAAIYLNPKEEEVYREVDEARRRGMTMRMAEGLPVGMSFGIAKREPGEAVELTIRRADLEMYREKAAYYEANGIERRTK